MCEEREESYSLALEYSQQLQKLLNELTEQRSRESYISQYDPLKFFTSKRHKLTPLGVSNAIALETLDRGFLPFNPAIAPLRVFFHSVRIRLKRPPKHPVTFPIRNRLPVIQFCY